MASQAPRQVSLFQYWWWRFRRIPLPVLLMFDGLFVALIFFFATELPQIPKEWYPGGVKTYPTTRNPFIIQTATTLPTLPAPSPLPLPEQPIQSVEQPAPIIAEALPEGQQMGVDQPQLPLEQPTALPTMQPTLWATANNATVAAWLGSPPSTTTPSPAPGEPGFAESFQPQPECNFFIGYVGPKRLYCDGVYATQTAEALP